MSDRAAAVERAARRVLAHDAWVRERRGTGFGPSADDVLEGALPSGRHLWTWAALARAALRRARELEGRDPRPEPSAPRRPSLRGGVPVYRESRKDGSWHPV